MLEELTFRNGATVVSRNFQISLSLRCGHRCLFCPVDLTGKDVTPDFAARALRDYAGPRAETELILTGGEPALSKALLDTARLGRDLGFRSITMLSSAASFADMAFARKVHAAGVRRLFLSLHSHRPQMYDLLTGTRRQFPRAVRGMTNVLRLPFEHVTCNMVMTKLNYADVPAHAAFLAGLRPRRGAPLALSLSALEENPRWDKLRVPHATVIPHARKAVEDEALPLAKFMGNWAIPACIGGLAAAAPSLIPDGRWETPAWYAPKNWAPASGPAPSQFVRVKSQACRGCSLDGVCAGLSRTYAACYGIGELVPIPGRRPSISRSKKVHIA